MSKLSKTLTTSNEYPVLERAGDRTPSFCGPLMDRRRAAHQVNGRPSQLTRNRMMDDWNEAKRGVPETTFEVLDL